MPEIIRARALLWQRVESLASSTAIGADVLVSNPAMLKVFRRGAGHALRMETDAGVYEIRMKFAED